MLQRLLPVASIVDRFSQHRYRLVSRWLLRKAGVTVSGLPLWVSPRAYLDISGPGSISLGDECVISHDVKLLTHDFSLDRAAERLEGKRQDDLEYVRRANISIGDHAFIGMNAMILPGVTIGAGAIVGAGSVVTRDVAVDTIVAGNPAKVVTSTGEYLDRMRESFHLGRRRR